jgi:hypothetical protein
MQASAQLVGSQVPYPDIMYIGAQNNLGQDYLIIRGQLGSS